MIKILNTAVQAVIDCLIWKLSTPNRSSGPQINTLTLLVSQQKFGRYKTQVSAALTCGM